jgi:tripartite ATP-independent transporter DctM subunit
MAIIVPGFLLAIVHAVYIITRCHLQPSIAPAYNVPSIPVSDKLIATIRYILPLGFVVLAVTGVIFLGIATPTEAAATGAASCFILAACYKALNWELVKKSTTSALRVTVMIFMIVTGAATFSQVLAYSGATRGLTEFTVGLPVSPMLIIIATMVVVFILGCFMDVVAIMMITVPIFMPIINAIGANGVWFVTIFLLNVEMAMITPPFGMSLFVMKGVASADTTMGDIYKAGLPFIGLDILVMVLIMAFPALALWLPGIMR